MARNGRGLAAGLRSAGVLGGLAAIMLAAPVQAGAADQRIQVPIRSAFERPAHDGGFRDRIIGRKGAARRALARAAVSGGTYTSPDGYRVVVQVSDSYVPSDADNQAFVNFLASNLHGFELGKLRILISTPEETSQLCGGGEETLACYAPGESRMYVPGSDSAIGGSPEYSITHEYGHHITNWRNNAPWDALDYGTKRWATFEHVCKGVRQGLFFPGNQGAHYLDDPGEGFADSYAQLHFTGQPFQYNPLLRPSRDSFARIVSDIRNPWPGPRSRRFRGSLSRSNRSDTFRIPIGLDGSVGIRLKGPRGTNFNLRLRKSGHTVRRARRRGSSDKLRYRWCRRFGPETIVAQVVRKRGSGPFRIRVSWPG